MRENCSVRCEQLQCQICGVHAFMRTCVCPSARVGVQYARCLCLCVSKSFIVTRLFTENEGFIFIFSCACQSMMLSDYLVTQRPRGVSTKQFLTTSTSNSALRPQRQYGLLGTEAREFSAATSTFTQLLSLEFPSVSK